MKELVKILELNKYEIGIIINALNDTRNKMIQEEKDSYYIDELILKILDAPDKKRSFRKYLECR